MNNLITKKSSFATRFKRHYRLRLHMSLLLLATVCSGLLATRIMLALHLQNVVVRYPLAVVFAYLVFFIWVKLWLKYVISFPATRSGRGSSMLDIFPGSFSSGSSGGATGADQGFRGGGGNFGGGGASGGFGEVDSALAGSAAEVISAGPDTGGSVAAAAGDVVGDAASSLDDSKGCLVALALAAIAAVIFGAGIYLIYYAPFILSEAAFEVILAASLVRGARRIERGDWMGSVFKATWIPFTLTLLLSLLAGYLIHHSFPGVTRISELFAHFF
jgi:hypothetical protein